MSLLKELKTGIQYNSIKVYKYRRVFESTRMPEIARINVCMQYNADPVYTSSFKCVSKKGHMLTLRKCGKGHMLTLRKCGIIRKCMIRSSFKEVKGNISYYDRIKGCFSERTYSAI